MITGMVSTSPRLRARIAGVLYLAIFIAAPSGAANATPAKMVITLACDIGVALLFYNLLKPVNKHLALLSTAFRLILVVMMAANSLIYFGLFDWFHSARSASAFNAVYGISLVPFGAHCMVTGYLIYRSTFLPKILGILFALAGVAYLTFIWPPLGDHLFFPYVVVPGVVGEGSLTIWLILMGVNSERWENQRALSAESLSAS
jgi:Domain of unknown function (DUF4386)